MSTKHQALPAFVRRITRLFKSGKWANSTDWIPFSTLYPDGDCAGIKALREELPQLESQGLYIIAYREGRNNPKTKMAVEHYVYVGQTGKMPTEKTEQETAKPRTYFQRLTEFKKAADAMREEGIAAYSSGGTSFGKEVGEWADPGISTEALWKNTYFKLLPLPSGTAGTHLDLLEAYAVAHFSDRAWLLNKSVYTEIP